MTGDPREVVLTGVGAVSPCGIGYRRVGEALVRGDVAPRTEMDRPEGYHRANGSRLAALVKASELRELIPPRESRRLSPPSRLAVAAARLAVDDAGLSESKLAGERTGVVLATSYGASDYTERILRQLFADGPTGVSPSLFTESVANAPAAQVALKLGARGPNTTVTQREAGALIALGKGLTLLRAGRADRVLVGGAEEASPLLHAVLDRFRALAPGARTGEEEIARPFDRRRSGFVLGEGATVWVLERAGDAISRGAPVQAKVEAVIHAFDPESPAHTWSVSGETLARALRAGLGVRGADLRGVNRIVSQGSGAVGGDRLQADLLRRLFEGEGELPEVLAPAATLGEYCGNAMAAVPQALAGGEWAATPGLTDPDDSLGVVPWRGGSLAPAQRLLLGGCAVGGAAAIAVLSRWRG